MKIATFNINGIKARLPRLKEWLEETRPTVACLQEIKSQDDGFPAGEFEELGYAAIWHGQKSFNGVAILVDKQACPDGPTKCSAVWGFQGLAIVPRNRRAISKPTSMAYASCAFTCPTVIRCRGPNLITK